MKIRKFLSIFLTLALLISMCAAFTMTVGAADKASSKNLQLTATVSQSSEVEGWDWNAKTKTLTLNGFNLNTEASMSKSSEIGIAIDCDATIYLKGNNKIFLGEVEKKDGSSAGIFVNGDCILQGDKDSRLVVFSGYAPKGSSCGLSATGDITFQSNGYICFVSDVGEDLASDSMAVSTSEEVFFKSGKTILSTASFACLAKKITVDAGGAIKGTEAEYKLDTMTEEAFVEDRGGVSSFTVGFSRKLAKTVSVVFPDMQVSVEDTPAAWAASDVEQAIANGILPESLQGKYCNPITRGEFCELIGGYIKAKTGKTVTEYCRALNAKAVEFYDVEKSEENILGIAGLGIITGFPDNTFRPEAVITRQDAAIILARLATAMGATIEAKDLQFSDAADISGYAKPGVAYVSSLGIMNGNADGSFAPKRMITREQAIITVMNAWRKIN